jgi:hypothetical protein
MRLVVVCAVFKSPESGEVYAAFTSAAFFHLDDLGWVAVSVCAFCHRAISVIFAILFFRSIRFSMHRPHSHRWRIGPPQGMFLPPSIGCVVWQLWQYLVEGGL